MIKWTDISNDSSPSSPSASSSPPPSSSPSSSWFFSITFVPSWHWCWQPSPRERCLAKMDLICCLFHYKSFIHVYLIGINIKSIDLYEICYIPDEISYCISMKCIILTAWKPPLIIFKCSMCTLQKWSSLVIIHVALIMFCNINNPVILIWYLSSLMLKW